MNHPKDDKKIQKVIDKASIRSTEPGYGMVLAYYPEENIADVMMAQPGSELPGEIFNGVPCPVNMGVQTVAPKMGRPCWVVFKDGTQSAPMITHFFNFNFRKHDHEKQYAAFNDIPKFMTEL